MDERPDLLRRAAAEGIGTFALVFAGCGTIAIGGTVGLDGLFGGPITGASMNPARSIGPALVPGELHDLWIYLVGPILGAALGALAYQVVRGTQPAPEAG